MKFEISRDGALKQLDAFINSELANYSFKRNFDLGPKDKSNVSCLSPYISHRLITEYEVAKTVLAKFPLQKVEKYIQEIFWRVYWKGWLELRPQVWTDFLEDLKGLKEDDNYKKAINGETQIECFNDWVKELKENNYLHNHTRMWFASIWIFTLNLPWQKGAEFFMKHLYDGDAASNTLSWRWVAGLQTKGKHYVAQSWNISKFTNNKYKNVKLNENASPITDRREYKLSSLEINKEDLESDTLIFFESEQNIETLNLKDYRNIYCVFLNNEKRKIKFDEKVINFKKKIIEDQVNRFSNIKIIDEINFDKYTNEIKDLDVIYPSIGENLSFLKSIKKKKNLNYNFIVRDGDEFCWQFSNKGYFNFKSNIPKIIQKIT
jgi:deoxyribodipyrimidine photo-lyase